MLCSTPVLSAAHSRTAVTVTCPCEKMCRIVLVAKHANNYSDLCQCEYTKRRETYAKRQCLVFWYRCRCTQDAEEQARFLQTSRCGKTNKQNAMPAAYNQTDAYRARDLLHRLLLIFYYNAHHFAPTTLLGQIVASHVTHSSVTLMRCAIEKGHLKSSANCDQSGTPPS